MESESARHFIEKFMVCKRSTVPVAPQCMYVLSVVWLALGANLNSLRRTSIKPKPNLNKSNAPIHKQITKV